MIHERNRTTLSASTLQQRAITKILRDGLDMISEGESLTYQPDNPLGNLNDRWVKSGMAVRNLNLILSCAVPGSTTETVYAPSKAETEDPKIIPTFIVYKGRD